MDVQLLPPGFQFVPTDEELVIHYLSKKVMDPSFTATMIGEVNVNKQDPWKFLREYFSYMRDPKYHNDTRSNRATPSGRWRANGKEKKVLITGVAIRETFLFYKRIYNNREKREWGMHKYSVTKEENWGLIKVFKRCSSRHPSIPPTEAHNSRRKKPFMFL